MDEVWLIKQRLFAQWLSESKRGVVNSEARKRLEWIAPELRRLRRPFPPGFLTMSPPYPVKPQSARQTDTWTSGPSTTWHDDYDPYDPDWEHQAT